MRKKTIVLTALLLLPFFNQQRLNADSTPAFTLARVYQQGIDVGKYFVSEKLDGVRAFWNGSTLISRQGNIYHAPHWFTEKFPSRQLDGELWFQRNGFEKLVSIVRKKVPVESEWRQVTYMVFELPDGKGSFAERYSEINRLLANTTNKFIRPVKQFKVKDHQALKEILEEVVSKGGEGLMLHKADAPYQVGRTNDLLKVKPYLDAEAIVRSHLPGKGKFSGMTGALEVEMEDGTKFRIGTGFSDSERKNPPPIGSIITFKYYGKTNRNIPKFASFLRIRKDRGDRNR